MRRTGRARTASCWLEVNCASARGAHCGIDGLLLPHTPDLPSVGLAGAVSRTATAPIDRVKLLLQVHGATEQAKALTLREGIRRITSEGTVRAYFRGNGTNVLKIAPETAIRLTCNDRIKHALVADPQQITPLQRLCTGALSGAVGQAAIYPLELVRTRLAVCPPGAYAGIWDCVRSVVARGGLRGLYRGLLPSLIGILPYAGIDVAVFELLKEKLLDYEVGKPPSAGEILTAGMVSSTIAQLSSYPLALVRTRLQAQGMCGAPVRYSGMVDCFVKTVQAEGLRGLYAGILPNIAKVAPAAAICWYTFEEVKLLLGIDPRT